MSLSIVFHTPLMLLLPVAGNADVVPEGPGEPAFELVGQVPGDGEGPQVQRVFPDKPDQAMELPQFESFRVLAESFRVSGANQVRIEQRMTIRVSPQSAPVRPNMLMDLPNREIGPRFQERRIGKCLPISGISGVQPDGGHQLILFMRDRRMVSARLERACRARDFYSGFYLSRSTDGQLCVERDALQSRSGANCKLTRIRQLVEVGN